MKLLVKKILPYNGAIPSRNRFMTLDEMKQVLTAFELLREAMPRDVVALNAEEMKTVDAACAILERERDRLHLRRSTKFYLIERVVQWVRKNHEDMGYQCGEARAKAEELIRIVEEGD